MSDAEMMGLAVAAEQLVREGHSRAEVSRILNVPAQTLAGWALRHGFRKKDLEREAGDRIYDRFAERLGRAKARVLEEGAREEAAWRRLMDEVRRLGAVEAARRLSGPEELAEKREAQAFRIEGRVPAMQGWGEQPVVEDGAEEETPAEGAA